MNITVRALWHSTRGMNHNAAMATIMNEYYEMMTRKMMHQFMSIVHTTNIMLLFICPPDNYFSRSC